MIEEPKTSIVTISGLWTAMFFLGGFIGPTFAGFFVEKYGFRWMTFVEWMSIAIILIIDIVDLIFKLSCKAQKKEKMQRSSYSELE